jgi:hypothetical protein
VRVHIDEDSRLGVAAPEGGVIDAEGARSGDGGKVRLAQQVEKGVGADRYAARPDQADPASPPALQAK